MMNFKELLKRDNQRVFLNTEEFSEEHIIDGKSMPCLIDNNELVEREKKYRYKAKHYIDNISIKSVLIYVNAADFGALPAVGRVLTLDKKSYIVVEAINEGGVYSITLEVNKA